MPTYKQPKRFFEDAGTVDPESAYHVELENVVNSRNQDLKTLVDMGRYFSIFAPRQSGKTTFYYVKINRSKLQTTLDKAIDQISRKYMATERASEGYIVVFDAKTTVGETAVFGEHEAGGKKITSLVMGIGRPD